MELVKREDHYGLYNEDGHKIAATLDGCNSKLSKENCDEIFGVTDTEKLADEYCTHEPKNVKELRDVNLIKLGFRDGFNKAMELSKDKLFTMEDVDKIFTCGKLYQDSKNKAYSFQNVLNKLRQPTEIEVEIEMDICGDKVYAVPEPKLDENGCLILKRI